MNIFNSHIILRLSIICIAFIFTSGIHAQSVSLQVVTKDVEKKMKYKEGQILSVHGEKSKVDITPWEKDYISITLQLTAQHPERAVAEEDLESFDYSFKSTRDTIFIQNNIKEKEETLRSGMQAFYVIKIPASCQVRLDNYFGTALLTDLNQGVDIKAKFSDLQLKNIGGEIKVNTYFGDLIGIMINGNVAIEARRSNVTLSEIEGKFKIDSYQGVVKVFANQSLLDMNINAEKSDVFFYDAQLTGYDFNLTSQHGDIELPDQLSAHYTKQNDIRNIIIKPEGELIGVKVAISVVSGDIMLGGH